MPIYEYRCENGHQFEVFQSMSDDPLTKCEECGAPVQKVLAAPAIHFKGSGFHNTDYKNKGKAGAKDGDSESKSESKPDSGSGEKKPDGSKSDSSKTKTASD